MRIFIVCLKMFSAAFMSDTNFSYGSTLPGTCIPSFITQISSLALTFFSYVLPPSPIKKYRTLYLLSITFKQEHHILPYKSGQRNQGLFSERPALERHLQHKEDPSPKHIFINSAYHNTVSVHGFRYRIGNSTASVLNFHQPCSASAFLVCPLSGYTSNFAYPESKLAVLSKDSFVSAENSKSPISTPRLSNI